MSDDFVAAAVDAGILKALVPLFACATSSIGDDCVACIGLLCDWTCNQQDASVRVKIVASISQQLYEADCCDESREGLVFAPLVAMLKSNADKRLLVGLLHVFQGVVQVGHTRRDEGGRNPCLVALERHGFPDTLIDLQASSDGDVRRVANDCALKCDVVQMLCADLGAGDSRRVSAAAGRLRRCMEAYMSDDFVAAAVDAGILKALVRLLPCSVSSIGDDCAACIGVLCDWACKQWQAGIRAKILAGLAQLLYEADCCDESREGLVFAPLVSMLKSNADKRLLVGLLHVFQGVVQVGHTRRDEGGRNPCLVALERHGFPDTLIDLQASSDGDVRRVANDCALKCDVVQMLCADLGAGDSGRVAAAVGRLRRSMEACMSDDFVAAAVDAGILKALVPLLACSTSSIRDDCAACIDVVRRATSPMASSYGFNSYYHGGY